MEVVDSDPSEVFSEKKFSVVIEEVDVPLSPNRLSYNYEDHSSLCCCSEEIKYLKETVKQLVFQVKEQGQIITGIKSGLRNAVISLSACYTDNKTDQNAYNNLSVDYSNVQPIVATTSEFGSNIEDQLLPHDGADQYLTGVQREETEDPLGEVTSCSSVYVENSIDAISIPSSSQVVVRQEEKIDDDDMEYTDDIEENKEDDKLYSPSEHGDDSDQDLDNYNIDKNIGSENSLTIPKNRKSALNVQAGISSKEGFRCTKCSKPVFYKTPRNLRDHMRRYHSKNPYKCKLCEKVYVKSSSLAHHIHSFHKGNRLQCSYCPGSFVQLSKLRVHEKIHLEKDGPPLQCCEFCGMNFRTIRSLLAHLGAMHKDT